jgi:hypothetical protein
VFNIRRLSPLAVAIIALTFAISALPTLALPASQVDPCVNPQGCPDPVNPEPDEYYAIQCMNNAIWVFRSVPINELVTIIPIVQVVDLADGEALPLPNAASVTRSGDTITVSGSNGNRAPEAGSKSFSLQECISRFGPVFELPPTPPPITDEEAACLELADETQVAACLANLSIERTQTCESLIYASTHVSECYDDPCENLNYRVTHQDECPIEGDSSLEIVFSLINACFNPVGAGAAVVSFAAIRQRIRKSS